ncbi:MAG: ZPR1 zinc finger domain-containing protein [Methanomicrobiales archaeon]|nr:ZPR1 zinc finger domain-containing protein [Methanomicrobiales archaeon]
MDRVIRAPCLQCSEEIEYLYKTIEIPYFSDALITTVICPSCGFRSVDVMILGENEPARYTLAVSAPKDMEARVVRSTTSTIELPELGILAEPGPICEGFITNVEGVLVRMIDVVNRVISWSEGEELERAEALKVRIEDMRSGNVPFTLVIQDQDGNSAIIHPNAVKSAFVPYEDRMT